MIQRSSFKSVVQPSLKAVVSIYTSKEIKRRRDDRELSFSPFLFGIPPSDDTPKRQQALGSGVIVRKDGLVVTNNHVISTADEIKVVLVDGRTFDAKVVLQDADADLAALRFVKTSKNSQNFGGSFPFIPLGCGETLEVGDVVLAIGNNLGLQGTVTQGIISAVGRVLANNRMSSKITVPLVQTSASINPGSSGGALVDMQGHLVGINTAILTPSRGNVGLAFAVPANYIIPLLRAVDAKLRRVQRPYIGCTLGKIEYPAKGVLIHDVVPEGPAAKGGIKAKDIILELNDQPVTDTDRLLMMIATQNIQSEISLKIQRGNNFFTRRVVIGIWKPREQKILVVKDEGNPFYGTTLSEMNPQLNSQLGIEASKRGVVVKEIAPRTSASGLFRRGDRVLQIDENKIANLTSLKLCIDDALKKKKRSIISIRVARGAIVIEFRLSIGGTRSKL
mmetsp:Transcript_4308/g.6443  ORF Transcript_4308/g.6443 Transcript_4308/m.6443 type:complete len:449 (+) Transcript_4308:105-1451(+)